MPNQPSVKILLLCHLHRFRSKNCLLFRVLTGKNRRLMPLRSLQSPRPRTWTNSCQTMDHNLCSHPPSRILYLKNLDYLFASYRRRLGQQTARHHLPVTLHNKTQLNLRSKPLAVVPAASTTLWRPLRMLHVRHQISYRQDRVSSQSLTARAREIRSLDHVRTPWRS